MIKINLLNSSVATAIALSGSALAGDVIAEAAAPAPSNNGDWCAGFETLVNSTKTKMPPSFSHSSSSAGSSINTPNIDGENGAGDSFSEGIDEVRRFRFGSESSFLMASSSRVTSTL